MVFDPSAWIEVLADGPNADTFEAHLLEDEEIVVPTIVLYEVYKIVKRERDDEDARRAWEALVAFNMMDLDPSMALAAAETSLEHGLAMADAIVYATAQTHDAVLVTGDADFEGLPDVEYIPAASLGQPAPTIPRNTSA